MTGGTAIQLRAAGDGLVPRHFNVQDNPTCQPETGRLHCRMLSLGALSV